MPPPGCPNSACGFVKKSQLTAPAPRRATESTTIARTATATRAATVASTSIARFMIRRRRLRLIGRAPEQRSSRSSKWIEPAHDDLGDQVGDQPEDEQDRGKVEQGRGF